MESKAFFSWPHVEVLEVEYKNKKRVKGSVSTDVDLSSVQDPGWLFDRGDYTTQLYGDYIKPT